MALMTDVEQSRAQVIIVVPPGCHSAPVARALSLLDTMEGREERDLRSRWASFHFEEEEGNPATLQPLRAKAVQAARRALPEFVGSALH